MIYIKILKQEFLYPKLIPIENIIDNLKEVAARLPKGLYFPFTCQKQEWLNIEKVAYNYCALQPKRYTLYFKISISDIIYV